MKTKEKLEAVITNLYESYEPKGVNYDNPELALELLYQVFEALGIKQYHPEHETVTVREYYKN